MGIKIPTEPFDQESSCSSDADIEISSSNIDHMLEKCRSFGALLSNTFLPETVYLVDAKSQYFDFLQLLKQCNEFTMFGANYRYTLHVANPPSEYIFHLQLLRSIGIKIFYVNSLCQIFVSRIKYLCPQITSSWHFLLERDHCYSLILLSWKQY
jgi:hypothetical protein